MNKWLTGLVLGSLVLAACSAPTTPTEVVIASAVATQAVPTGTPAATATIRLTSTPLAATATPVPTEIPTLAPTPANSETVIEYEMRASFDFFWEQANTEAGSPGYGLIRDRFPGSEGIASIASVGFGLTAYLIGIEKGYITREEGLARADQTLDTLLSLDRTEGFFYHFLDLQTGKRAWQSEVSTIDTSLLMMGVLAAGQYFGGDVAAKAQQIYADINWPWMIDDTRNMFYMAYRPEKGFEGYWDYYAEQLMLYVLAAGSDTHPIDDAPYYGFTRHYAKFGDGQPFIHSWFGSIFTYQYSHAWIDFRPYTDREGVNWFDNSVAASLAQIDFATAVDADYLTLGPTAWGLTASDGPHGYNGLYGAPPSGSNDTAHLVDDTVAPSGAIGSIIFVPEQAQQAMVNYYSLEQLRGRYGFVDAYNLTEDWYASDVIGIDKGVTLLMLANYQDDTVYRVVMQNQLILNGLSRLGLAASAAAGTPAP